MRFFGTPYHDGSLYRESSRLPRREDTAPITDNRTQGTRGVRSNTVSEEALLLTISRLSFVKVELELYLDGYPECQNALRYYREIVAKLKEATDEYEAKFGPLTADATRADAWRWVQGKWPWQLEEGR